jgi:DNA-binding FrmR family transcriptional regulator
MEHKPTHEKEAVLKRFRRIRGQTEAILRMAEEDAYCIDLLTQIAAARAALLAAGKIILKDHMRYCVTESFKKGRSDKAIEEIETILTQFIK